MASKFGEGTNSEVLGLDLKSGKKIWSFKPKINSHQRTFADLDGDGGDELLLLDGAKSVAYELPTGKMVWQSKFAGAPNISLDGILTSQTPYVAVDMNADAKQEVILQSGGSGQLQFLAGDTGKVRWHFKLQPNYPDEETRAQEYFGISPRESRWLVGPDVNNDGFRDVFIAGDFEERNKHWLTVAAVSGKTGKAIWSVTRLIPKSVAGARLDRLFWWEYGTDGWPQLGVFTSSPEGILHFFSISNGRLCHVVKGCNPQPADINGDGLPDLYWLEPLTPYAPLADGGEIHVLQGKPPVLWRRLEHWQPAGDQNGDGVPEFISHGSNFSSSGFIFPKAVTMISGKNGSIVWQRSFSPLKGFHVMTWPLYSFQGDLDGDGGPDLLAVYNCSNLMQVIALSGKNGFTLWSKQFDNLNVKFAQIVDLDKDGIREVVLGCNAAQLENLISSGPKKLGVVVLSSKDGSVRWKSEFWAYEHAWQSVFRLAAITNLDGDGTDDIVVHRLPAEYQALSGKDGKILWGHSRRFTPPNFYFLASDCPKKNFGDLNGDGVPEICLVDDKLYSMDGNTGKAQWSWEVPIPNKKDLHRVVQLAPILADLEGKGQSSVCLIAGWGKLHIIDAQGKVHRTISIPGGSMYWDNHRYTQLWPHDCDGDGKQELAYIARYFSNQPARGKYKDTLPEGEFSAVRVLTDAGRRLLCEWPFPFGFGEIVEILPASKKRPTIFVIRSGNSIYGLAGPTGDVLWRCEGPKWWHNINNDYRSYNSFGPVLVGHDALDLPVIYFHGFGCRLAIPTSPDGKYRSPLSVITGMRLSITRPVPQKKGDRTEAILKQLAEDFPHIYRKELPKFHRSRSFQHSTASRIPEAKAAFKKMEDAYHQIQAEEFRKTEAGYRASLKRNPKSAGTKNSLAWFLATCPDPHFRKPKVAIQLAKEAVQQEPKNGSFWNTLGVSHYRNGDWQSAIDALQKSLKYGGANSYSYFFLAMAQARKGNRNFARQWYQQGLAAIQNRDELLRFRAEAALVIAESK